MLMPTFGNIRSTKHGMNRVTVMKSQAPNSKHQTSSKHQDPNKAAGTQGLARSFLAFCSSRRKEAPYLVVPSQEKLEPPYVGCYESKSFQLLRSCSLSDFFS